MEKIKLQSFETLTKRPTGMDFETYREIRRERAKKLKQRLKGVLVFKAVELIIGEDGKVLGKAKGSSATYVTSIHGKLPAISIE